MINYNPKSWFALIFSLAKGDTFKKALPSLLGVALYTFALIYFSFNILNISKNSDVKNINVMHSILGFVISLLLVFRTNTAYDRWWEGRKLLGSLTNNSRNLAIKISVCVQDKGVRKLFLAYISSFAIALKNHLRNNENFTEIDPILDLKTGKHLPIQITQKIHEQVNYLLTTKQISSEQYSSLREELRANMEICGACERIKNTPIPYSYTVFIKKFIFIYVITLPLSWMFVLGYTTIFIVVFVLYVLLSLELIAEEIENPFGTDANDLPVDQICANIKKHCAEILE